MDSDILVSGGGVVGLSTALAMVVRGFSVAVMDAGDFAPPDAEDFQRMYAINAASQHLFGQLGVWQALDRPACTPYQAMEVRDSRSDGLIAFDCRSLAMPALGHIIGEKTLKRALLHQLHQQHNIQLLAGQRIERLQDTGHGRQVFTRDKVWQSRLLMVAEGAQSSTRTLLGVGEHSWSYHQHALVVRVHCEKAHASTARQLFLPDGPLAFLPLPDNHQCSIVWSCRPAQARYLQSLPVEEFNETLTNAFQRQLGYVSCLSPRQSFPLHMRHVRQYSGNNWLLLGDSAHSIHPLAGLGLNVGLADLRFLLDAMDQNPAQLPSVKTLSAWQRQRKAEVWKVIALMQALKTLFQTPAAPVIGLRGLGLSLVNRLHPIKHYLMRQAIGR